MIVVYGGPHLYSAEVHNAQGKLASLGSGVYRHVISRLHDGFIRARLAPFADSTIADRTVADCAIANIPCACSTSHGLNGYRSDDVD